MEVEVDYNPKLGGYSMVVPVGAILTNGVGCVGFTTNYKFLEIAATIIDLAPKAFAEGVKPKKAELLAINDFDHGLTCYLLWRMVELCATKQDGLANGFIKAVFAASNQGGRYFLRSLYPMPNK